MWRWVMGTLWLMKAQNPLPYKELHHRLYSLVRDTSHREWLLRLRQEMEAIRRIEWNDRFFREIAGIYLNQSDTITALLSTARRYLKVDSSQMHRIFLPTQDKEADAATIIAVYETILSKANQDTSHTGYLLRQGSKLARSIAESWLSAEEQPPLSILIEAGLKGYLKALVSAYAFFGFDASPETWQEKMRVIEAVGLLEYYAYGESANTFRAWRRGYVK
ncbi:MAG: hypothetical protein NZZ60_05495 [Bacteroidia bacterium]|nr:hypothetical protein [Bacteroidia bacterium]MDW8416936.1 hypothetical protein [Bacteroidia bacterium]